VTMTNYLVRSNSRVTGYGRPCKRTRRLSDGSIVVAVIDRTNYYGYLRRSTNGGQNWSDIGNSGEAVGTANDNNMMIDVDSSDNIYMVFTKASGGAVYLYKFTRSGDSWTKGSSETVATADSTFPKKRGGTIDIWVAPNGVCFVAYGNYYDAAGGIRRRNADGTWETAIKVWDGGSNIDTLPMICGYRAADGTNRIALYIRSASNQARAYYSTNMGANWTYISDLGTEAKFVSIGSGYKEAYAYVSSGNIRLKVKDSQWNTYTVDNSGLCDNPSVSIAGNLIRVAYRYNGNNSAGDIAYKISGDLGQTWGSRVDVSNDATAEDFPAIDYDDDGGINIAWERGTEVYFTRIPLAGWRKLKYLTEPPSSGWNKLKFASEPPVSGAWNKLLYEGE